MEITQNNCTERLDEPFIMVTGTIGFGEIPQPVQAFLEVNHDLIRAVAQVVIEIGDKISPKPTRYFGTI